MSEHHGTHDAHASHHHISPASLYWTVWVGLMILTIITVLAYYIPLWLHLNLGAANVIIAMAIATTKASLVCLYFMQLKYDKKFHAVAFLSSLIFLALFLSFTLLDITTREDQPAFAKPVYAGKTIEPEAEGAAPTHAGSEAKPVEAAKPAGGEAKPTEAAKPSGEAKPAASAAAKPAEGAKPAGAEAKPAEATKH